MNYRAIVFLENSLFLVTGGAVFICLNLCEAILSMGHRVRVLDNLSTGYAVTKFAAKEYAYQYAMHYGLDCYGMRCFNIYGCRQDPNGASEVY